MGSDIEISKSVILFDGYCNLCNSQVNSILRFDYKKKLQESYRTNGITVLKRHVKNYVYPPQLEFDGSVFITVRTKYFSKHIRLDYGSSPTSKGLNNETKH